MHTLILLLHTTLIHKQGQSPPGPTDSSCSLTLSGNDFLDIPAFPLSSCIDGNTCPGTTVTVEMWLKYPKKGLYGNQIY